MLISDEFHEFCLFNFSGTSDDGITFLWSKINAYLQLYQN
jgi:hypothetical protein